MRGKFITWRGMIFIAGTFLVIFAVLLSGVLISRRGMEAQYAQQQAVIVVMEQEVAALRNELARVGSDGYVEIEARTRYDYVRNGEIRFEFSDPALLDNYTMQEWEVIMDEQLYPTY